MNPTERLIAELTQDVRPVTPLRPPAMRTLGWLALAALVLGAITMANGLRPTIAQDLQTPKYLWQLVFAFLTGITAAFAVFANSVPGRSRAWLWLPWIPFAGWMASLGYGCIADWIEFGPDGMSLGHSVGCFATITFSSIPLGAILLLMVRHAGVVHPVSTATLGGLSVAALSAFALTLHHDLDATLMLLVWHMSAVGLVILVARRNATRLFGMVGLKRL